MKHRSIILCSLCVLFSINAISQGISNFISVQPANQIDSFILPNTHVFQKIIETGDSISPTKYLHSHLDFTGYVPISGSSTNGYLSLNHESTPGGVTILDINYNSTSKLWGWSSPQEVDFSAFGGTGRNCSGAITPWNTVISCEEIVNSNDVNSDGYHDYGWNVEIDPVSKTVINKRWAMGKFMHENVAIHSNQRTVYQGADSNPGYLYKFVADTAQKLGSGKLYVYSGSKSGAGNWLLIDNTTQADRNSTLTYSANVGGTVFSGVEDVEIGPDGWIYFAVKNEDRVYRLQDSDPIMGTTATVETYVGNMNYDIVHSSGVTNVSWGTGNDNMAFDNDSNLWVLQDGGEDYIWVVENGHTQMNPKVKLFGISPAGSEPTGITFTPDYKFLFMTFMHPSSSNNARQVDAKGDTLDFNIDIALVVALENDLGLSCAHSYDTISANGCQSYISPSGKVWSQDGNYQDTIPNNSGCDSIITINLTIFPILTDTINQNLCFGDSIIVNGNIYDTTTTGGIEVFPNIGPGGCDSVVTINLIVQNELDTSVNVASDTLISNEPGVSYQWFDCSSQQEITGDTLQQFIVTIDGSYAVLLSNGSCVDTSSCIDVVINNLKILPKRNNYRIYPNPTSGDIDIELDQNVGQVNVTIKDIKGRIVYTSDVNNKTLIRVPSKDWEKGIYLIHLECNQCSYLEKKFIKE